MDLFTLTIFGKCPRCGGGGGDTAVTEVEHVRYLVSEIGDLLVNEDGTYLVEYAESTAADAEARDTEGNGYELIMFRGEAMCERCKDRILDDEQSRDNARRFRDEQKFRSRAGVKTAIT